MSRHGYSEDLEQQDLAMWRGRVASASRGQRGQKLFVDLRNALDAMPEKRLISGDFQNVHGECCALGCVGMARGHDMRELDPEQDNDSVAGMLDVAECLVQEVEWVNDEAAPSDPIKRWEYVRKWVDRQIKQ